MRTIRRRGSWKRYLDWFRLEKQVMKNGMESFGSRNAE
jgi:hypothetical protein